MYAKSNHDSLSHIDIEPRILYLKKSPSPLVNQTVLQNPVALVGDDYDGDIGQGMFHGLRLQISQSG